MDKLHVADPWLSFIADGTKTVEGRSGPKEKFSKWIGKDVLFFNDQSQIIVTVLDVRHYDTLYSYLLAENFKHVLPGINTFEDAVDIYHQFYSDEKIDQVGGMNGLVIKLK